MVKWQMGKTCIIYCHDFEAEVQRLTDAAQRQGWIITHTLTENPATVDHRAGIAAMRRMVAKGEVQATVVPSLIMLGASLDETVALIAKMADSRMDLIAESEGIDTTTQQGAGWMAAVASLHGFQRAVRRQKARAGQLRAKQAGVKFGRPPISDSTMKSVRAALAAGHGIRPTARKMGISPARVAVEKAAMAIDRGSIA